MSRCWEYFILSILYLNLFFYETNGCPNIEKLIHSLPYVSSPETNCTKSLDCSSVQCTAKSKDTEYSVGLAVVSCGNSPAIEVNVNIPAIGIIFWHATFDDQTEKIIPGYFFPPTSIQSTKKQGYLKVNLKKVSSSSSVILDFTLKGCEHGLENQETYPCSQKQIINNQQLACGVQKFRDRRKCSIYRPFDCGMKETCLQMNQSNIGECVCLQGLERDSNNECSMIDENLVVSTISSLVNETTEQVSTEHDPAALAVNIIVPILMLTLTIALFYAAYKNGLIHRLIVCWSGRHFEAMSVHADDDDASLT